MIDITDLILAADNHETEDKKLRSLSQQQAKDLILHLVPKELEFTFSKILKSDSPIDAIFSTLPFNLDLATLTIDFPYVAIGDDKITVGISYMDSESYEEETNDHKITSFSYDEFKNAI